MTPTNLRFARDFLLTPSPPLFGFIILTSNSFLSTLSTAAAPPSADAVLPSSGREDDEVPSSSEINNAHNLHGKSRFVSDCFFFTYHFVVVVNFIHLWADTI
jgi:hypothetical protein